MNRPLDFYQEKINQYTTTVNQLQQRWLLLSTLRLLSFVAMLVAGYYWIKQDHSLPLGLAVFFLIIFIVLVRIALTIRDQKQLASKLVFINQNEKNILLQQPNGFPDGKAFAAGGEYAADLDIFGPGSLFHLLNRTTTSHGTEQLAGLLQQPPLSPDTIAARQEAVKALSKQTDLRQLLAAHGLLHEEKEGNLHAILSWLQLPTVVRHLGWINIVRWLLPLYNLGALVYFLYTDNYGLLIPGILVSWLITGAFTKKILAQHTLLSKKQSILQQYAAILHLFSQAEDNGSTLMQQQKAVALEAHQAIKKLSALAGLFDQRLNLLVNFFLNSFGLYDIHCMWALDNWKNRYKDRFAGWIDCVGSIETLHSLASFAFNNPGYQYPEVVTGKPILAASQLGHPLIAPEQTVANDCDFGTAEQLILVTGSNMSGKTTFLRTLGVNLVLAQSGGPVCASSFRFTPMNILSSIRVSDSLQEHTSYFMAELKKLQQIVHYLQQQSAPALILIDEILRGTNSEDKTHGSEMFIKKLLQYNCLTLFATHDLMLSKLEQELPGQVNNYCFESTLRDGELYFDYTLQRGVAKNRNASFLMEKMEII
ncbi:MAG: hypothetical protein P0Y53_20230 [Candidatus Pseudobacter hemicellulosilyticus]|uniref:DNA mismatch repair proteins mutS family domain-containing protein n=1 Tax=Candidatus Pseudobacter hemicellulosilyticus TaxID=3121375 RepID=A0AAJ6BG10_9BACT|nr:MAG: hypothetical protein P0Y53_20230 [Pseudobacter sp.]